MNTSSSYFLKNSFSKAKGVLFDVDGTLYHQLPVRLTMMLFFVIQNILKPNQFKKKARIIFAYRYAMEALRKSSMARGNIYQIDMTAKYTGATNEYVASVVHEWFEVKPLLLLKFFRRKGAARFINTLLKRGYRVGVFSDYPAHDKLQALNLSHCFSVVVSASDPEVHGFKPNTNGFEISARKMGLQPFEIFYIGDRSEVDGIGAHNAGFHVILLKSFWELKPNRNFPSALSFYKLTDLLCTTKNCFKKSFP